MSASRWSRRERHQRAQPSCRDLRRDDREGRARRLASHRIPEALHRLMSLFFWAGHGKPAAPTAATPKGWLRAGALPPESGRRRRRACLSRSQGLTLHHRTRTAPGARRPADKLAPETVCSPDTWESIGREYWKGYIDRPRLCDHRPGYQGGGGCALSPLMVYAGRSRSETR